MGGVDEMRLTEITIIIIYILFCIILGFWSQKKISSSSEEMDDYYAAGRKVGTGANSLALMAALGSGGSFMAGSGTVLEVGVTFLSWMTVGSFVGFTLACFFVGKPLRYFKKIICSGFIND